MLGIATRSVAVFRTLGSLLRRRRAAPVAGRVVRPWRADAERQYPGVGLTPARLRAFLQAADAGAPQMQYELFSEMLERWPRLAAVEATRRLALTGLDWEIVPATEGAEAVRDDSRDGADARFADGACAAIAGRVAGSAGPRPGVRWEDAACRAADVCRATLAGLPTFRDVLAHLATAIGHGLAVAEIVWERGQLVDLVPVPHTRLRTDPSQPWRLRVLTAEDPARGVPLDAQPQKWIVHRPRAVPGRPLAGGLLRATALLYLAQHLSFKDWLIYSQIAGMPLRVAQFDPGTPEEDQRLLLRMLEGLGTEAVAVLSKNVELKLVEGAAAGHKPYGPLQDFCNTEVTILWLGQHLTTDLRSHGSRAAAEIHDRVREDLLVNDIADEGQTLRRDLLRPLVRAQCPAGTPVPLFRRSIVQAVDTQVLARTLAVAVNDLGLAVPRAWVYRALGIPEPQGGEAVLTGRGPRCGRAGRPRTTESTR